MPTLFDSARLLILADSPEVPSLVARLETRWNVRVALATDTASCLPWLHRETFDLLLLEETALQASSAELDAVYAAAADAPILELNFAMSSPNRIVRQVQAALRRHQLARQRAKDFAILAIRDELGSAVSGLLLQTQLLVERPGELSREALAEIVVSAEALSRVLRDDKVGVHNGFCIP